MTYWHNFYSFLTEINRMTSNLKKPGKSHDKRIHLESPREAVYWSKKFEVSSLQLLEAVKATGSNRVDAVARYLYEKVLSSPR